MSHLRIDLLHLLLVRSHEIEGDGYQDHEQNDRDQVVGGEDRLVEPGDLAGHLLHDVQRAAVSGGGERDRARQTRGPHHEAHVGGGDQKAEIHIAQALGDLARHQGADHQTEAPIEPRAEGCDEEHRDRGAGLMGGHGREFAEQPLDQRCVRERYAGDQNQSHLQRKRQNGPDAVVPGIDDLERVARGPDQRRHHRNERQDDGVEVRVWYVSFGVTNAQAGEWPQHDFCPLLIFIVQNPTASARGGLPALRRAQELLAVLQARATALEARLQE